MREQFGEQLARGILRDVRLRRALRMRSGLWYDAFESDVARSDVT